MSSLNLDPSTGFHFQEEEVEEDVEEEKSSNVIYQHVVSLFWLYNCKETNYNCYFQETKTEPVVIDTFHAALDDLPLNLYHDPWLNENHPDDFSLPNPSGLNPLSLEPSGTSGHPQLTYTNEPIYLVPSAPGTGTSTGGETSQNHTSNQASFQIAERLI